MRDAPRDGARRLASWFDEGLLVRPRSGPDLVDLVGAVASLCGAGEAPSAAAATLAARLGRRDHYVMVLVDGLGDELLARAPAGGIFRRCRADRLVSVFPSTTAAALSSIGTGAYPSEHGIPGWFVWLEEHGVTATVLPFTERFSGRDLAGWGVGAGDVFSVASHLPRFTHTPCSFTRREYVGSVYTEWVTGGTEHRGYEAPEEGAALVAERVLSATGPSYTSWYLPQLDKLCHERGVEDPEVATLLARLDAAVGSMVDRLGGAARVVITADHGHVTVPADRVVYVDEDGPLMDHLVAPPAGEATVPLFHVRPGHEEAFRREFDRLAGGAFALLSQAEVEAMGLFGPGPLSALARRRCGDFLAVAPRPTVVIWRPRDGGPAVHKGVHAGLTPGEMYVPLILA